MAKQKKRKTQHLSDAEIWDDSALIRSWDEAVAEYEYYHSIHARGEDVEEVLRQAELEESTKAEASAKTNSNDEPAAASKDEDFEDGEVEDEDPGGSIPAAGECCPLDHESKDVAGGPSMTNGNKSTHERQSDAGVKGSSQVLENIKMAYWWAGYYSGLYEGQQQVANSTATTNQQSS